MGDTHQTQTGAASMMTPLLDLCAGLGATLLGFARRLDVWRALRGRGFIIALRRRFSRDCCCVRLLISDITLCPSLA